MANFGEILNNIAIGASQSIRRNAADNGFEAFTPASSTSPLTTKGDIYTYSTGDARLPVGTNGYVLSADSAETTGLKWIAATGGLADVAIYGDYSDGDVTISGSTTLTRDMYYEDLIVDATGVLNVGTNVIYAKSVTVQSGGVIETTKQNGNNGSGSTGGTANSTISGASLPSFGASAAGGNGTTTAGAQGGAAGGVTLWGTARYAGDSGAGGTGSSGSGGSARIAAISTQRQDLKKLWLQFTATLSGGASNSASNQGGGGGGGGGDGANAGGGGGASGSGGGMIVIFAKTFNNAGTIRALGGNGGNGANATAGNTGGGAGGGGGGGGTIYIVTGSYTNTGTISVTGGSGGTGGTGFGTGTSGGNGTAGDDGIFSYIVI